MDSYIESRCVRIAGPDPKTILGSGFRLSAERVVTAWHVVEEDLDSLWVLDPEDGEWNPVEASLIWPDISDGARDVGYDVALLSTDARESIVPWAHFLEVCTEDVTSCRVVGFPDGEKVPEDRTTILADAVLYRDSDQGFQITPSGGTPRRIDHWAGISGSPVLDRSARPRLLGVLRGGPSEFEGRQLTAVPWPSLLDGEGFRELFQGNEEMFPAFAKFLQDMTRYVTENTALLLCQQEARWARVWKAESESTRKDSLLKTVCLETNLEEQAEALRQALVEALQQRDYISAANIFEILKLCLPATFLRCFEDGAPSQVEKEFKVPAVLDQVIEAAVAGVDGRPVRFRRPLDEREEKNKPSGRKLVQPELLIALPQEPGIDPKGQQRLSDYENQLATRIGLAKAREASEVSGTQGWKVTERTLELFVQLAASKRFGSSPLFPEDIVPNVERKAGKDPKAWEKAIRQVVAEGLKSQKEPFYCVLEADSDQGRAFLEQLRQKLPDLRRVVSVGDLGELGRETRVAVAYHEAHMAHENMSQDKKSNEP